MTLDSVYFIVPMKDSDYTSRKYHENLRVMSEDFSWKLHVVLNGPDAIRLCALESKNPGNPWRVGYGGTTYNPYLARNVALDYIFRFIEATHCVLIDADCVPDKTYNEALLKLIQGDAGGELLIAGRTKTRIPAIDTPHFNMLREAGFECYDGFTPPDHTIGANMVIGKTVWGTLGLMRCDTVSGGDGEYGIRFKASGGRVTVGSELIVYKTIATMTFAGVVEKQFRRAKCFPPAMVPEWTHALKSLDDSLWKCQQALSGVIMGETSQDYATFLDKIFKVMMHLGILTHFLDRNAPNEPGHSDRNP